MAKFCIFCGKPPENKNKEHVIPKWLIKMTGDENRVINLGYKKSKTDIGDLRMFAFDQFTFPACESCNSKYSRIESFAQKVMQKILASKPVKGEELSIFLDWFDKVRVGLWLGFQQLEKNFLDIEPNFHIEKRIGQYDRMLILSKTDESRLRLNIAGADSVSFAYTPSVFSLTVNNFCFVNISYSFLLSRRLGYPFPEKLYLSPETAQIQCDMRPGLERIMQPILKKYIPQDGIRIFQPMYPGGLVSRRVKEYDSNYVKNNSFDHEAGVGSIFLQEENDAPIFKMESLQEVTLQPKTVHDSEKLAIQTVINVCELQNWLTTSQVSLEKLPSDQRKYIKSLQRFSCGMNDVLIRHHKELLCARGYVAN